MSRFTENLKYLTVLFQARTNFIKYIKAVIIYRVKRRVEFPKALVELEDAKFVTRENSMDIAHLSGFYERETTRLLLDLNPKVFVDVGAHVGRFSVVLSKKGTKSISIEASKHNLGQLEKNIKLNGLQDRIKVVNCGCSDENGKKTLYFIPENEGLTSLDKKEGAKKETIEVRKLDDICKDIGLAPKDVNVIKIDVEGYELNVLKGATEILKKGFPLLIVEINYKEKGKEIREFLGKLGFYGVGVLDSRNFLFAKREGNQQCIVKLKGAILTKKIISS